MNMNRISCYALALSCLLASCKDEMKDEEMPTVSITAPQADTKVWLETTLATEVMDNQGVSKVEFYLDGDLIGEATEAPYELTLDTKQYKDGKHVLRTVAYDGANNQSEAEREIEILNTLLTVEVENNHLDVAEDAYDTERKWVIVADMEGNILQTEEAKNGTQYTFERPKEFSDSLISATIIDITNNQAVSVKTYHGISPDTWTFESEADLDQPSPTMVGQATGSYVTPRNYYHYLRTPRSQGYSYSTGREYKGSDSSKINFQTIMYQNSVQAYVVVSPFFKNEAPKYATRSFSQDGEHYDFTASDFKPMTKIKTIPLTSVEYASATTRGYYNSTKDYEFDVARSWDVDGMNISMYQPEEMFNNLEYSLFVRKESFSYNRYDKNHLPANYDIPQSVNFTISSTDRGNFKASVDRPCDYSYTNWFSIDYDQEFGRAEWTVFTEEAQDIQFSVSLPKVVTDAYPSLQGRLENTPFSAISLMDRDDITSFSEYAAKLYKKDTDLNNYKTYERVSVYEEDENARRATQDLPQRVQDELEEYEMHRMRK